MSIKLKVIAIISTALILLFAFSFWIASLPKGVEANESQFQPRVNTSSATTTPNFLTVGTATTTLTLNTGSLSKYDSASLLLQFHASSTGANALVSEIGWNYEFSRDGQDWYCESEALVANATSSIQSQSCKEYTWFQSATSTLEETIIPTTGDALATSSLANRKVDMPTPIQYARVNIYMPVSSTANASVYAEVIPVKEQR